MSSPQNSSKTISSAGRRHALLAGRARRLARPRTAPEPIPSVSCLVCEAGLELYAIPLANVVRIMPAGRVAATPSSNAALLGVTARAGVFYHVYDLAQLIGGGKAGSEGGHVVMLRGAVPIALRVDRALQVADIVDLSREASSASSSHPAIARFGRPLQDNLFDGRTISVVDPAMLSSEHAPARAEGD